MIRARTLTDGGQEPAAIAEVLAAFLRDARTSLDIAVYDFALSPAVEGPVLEAIRGAASRGVASGSRTTSIAPTASRYRLRREPTRSSWRRSACR